MVAPPREEKSKCPQHRPPGRQDPLDGAARPHIPYSWLKNRKEQHGKTAIEGHSNFCNKIRKQHKVSYALLLIGFLLIIRVNDTGVHPISFLR